MRYSVVTIGLALMGTTMWAVAQEVRVDLNPKMMTNETEMVDFTGFVDEQQQIIGPPAGKPLSRGTINPKYNKTYPYSSYIDMGEEKNLSKLWIFDTNGRGDLVISVGKPGAWVEHNTYDCGRYMTWVSIPMDVTTRYLRLTLMSPTATFTEIAVYEHTPEAWQALLDRKAAEAKAEAERVAALKRAREEALKRPLIEVAPYGTLSLVEEIDCAQDPGERIFAQYPDGHSRVETILGRQCRVLSPVEGEAAYFSYRIGRMKLLRPGGVYVLAVDYPEDAPRSMVVINTGNETARGFHTGLALGDAFKPKYVNSLVESIDVPLSGRHETWSLLLRLHNRYPKEGLVRGGKQRPLTAEDGFDVTIAQFSAENIPISKGAAVSCIRLYELIDPDRLAQPLNFPPDGLPRRHLFWREEMSTGVVMSKETDPNHLGVDKRIDWYRFKAELMRFLGMNTYSKDLLVFGACQHWDPTEYGGNDWVYHDPVTKDLWGQIVELMGEYGFDILPYYEYSGSKGYKGLGPQRRGKPLTRDDAYSHISWVEQANADITDPDTYEDFKKMLDLTVIRLKDKADFLGVWMRPRGQVPVSFGRGALERFSTEANGGKTVTRNDIKADEAIYKRYLDWWGGKRRDFFVAMRDHLRGNGIDDAIFLFTGCPPEGGVNFNDWIPRMITDSPDVWKPIVAQKIYEPSPDRPWEVLTPQQVAERDLYLEALTTPALTWADWEMHHSRPADDPFRYRDMEGVMLSHAFNRQYTVASPKTFDAYRTPSGLAIIRHYVLNENMMFDKNDKSILGYFVVDVERAGPYCMMAEAMAMANGDPTMIGYLVGNNFGRGFPLYVRNFNAAFLALPALPSRIVKGASSDPNIVVREIRTDKHGTWYALVNTGMRDARDVSIRLAGGGSLMQAVTGKPIAVSGDAVRASFYPYELKTWRRQ